MSDKLSRVSKAVKAELRQLSKSGVITPASVLKKAADPNTALHSMFEWNDKKASLAWRLEQARRLIMHVKIEIVAGENRTIRAREYVSLPADRSDRVYRRTEDVLKDPRRRTELLQMALAEFNTIRTKYSHLQELAGVFAALDKMKKQTRGAA